MKNIKDFFQIILTYNKKFMIVMVINVVLSALVPFPYIILSKILFDMLQDGQSYEDYVKIISLLVFLNIGIKFLYEKIDAYTEVKGQQLMFQLNCLFNQKTLLIDYEMLLNPKFLEERELAKKVITGSNFIDIIRGVKRVVSNVLIIMGIIFIIIQVGIYIILPIILVIVINTYINSGAKKAEYTNSVESVPYMRKIEYLQTVCSDFSFVKEVRIHNCKELINDKYTKLTAITFSYIKKIIYLQKKALQLGSITNGIQDFIIYSILGYKTIIAKVLTIGDFSMFFNAVNQFKTSVLEIMSAFIDMKINSLSIGHFLSYMNTEEKMKGEYQINNTNLSSITIEFKDVSFRYPGADTYALRNINCTMNGQDKILIVGENGAGKSTFINLLLRLYAPTEGVIELNGININTIQYDQYLKLFGVMFQDHKIFAFDVEENIAFGENVDTTRINQLLEKVGMQTKIETLPQGTKTIISKLYDVSGTDFSGGEKQKIAIARTLYRNAKIIVLDEPTSALDPLAEYEIYCNFNELTKNKMSFFISHRLASNKFSTRIMVFQEGQIVEDGTHKELIDKKGLYQSMFERQSEFYMEND
ncbi:ABC transporter ATP-binding protein [Anaeromicropila populeti]|uniref:ATP-binding cassette, subfamily C n=1 Tax=Anaeromicropila populeti TaxID=37658 RepID=A0A1I6IND9_9FIRM|nr:ABC transporter ATP-binding protein [Anaeromicropila populeti]SFR68139.1 ATP-binding cassette, subfamily C [Anaeromicropila populeti]